MAIKILCITVIVCELLAFSHSQRLHINRYFLPIDNIYDYIKLNQLRPGLHDEEFNSLVQKQWLYQSLDHFNPLDDQKFLQVSRKGDELLAWPYFGELLCALKKYGPICVYIGGDTSIHSWWLQHTYLAKTCMDIKGNLFLLEHRFYGESIPISNFTVETLRFLTVSQALEDIAVFVAFIRKRFKLEKNKLFVFGASYGGTLAALFRRKYPHLTDAAVAMSAPMKRDYENKDFLPSIGKKLKKTDIMCYKQIELGLRQATRLLENHICNKRELPLCNKIRENLGLCSSLKGMTPLERRLFFGTIAKDFTFLTEYNGLLNATVKNICDVIAHPNIAAWSPLDKLLAGDIVISKELFMSKVRSGECLPTKKQDICEYLSNVTIKHNAVATGKRQRLWQSCSELGSFPTSNGDSKQHPFGGVDVLPFSYFADFCYCAFGHPLTSPFIKQRIDAFTRTFGPSSLSIGTKIIYSIGEDDPRLQRELRSTEKLASKCSKHVDENRIFIAKGSAHCGEVFLKPATKRRMKPRRVSVVQERIVEQLGRWLHLSALVGNKTKSID